jgi:hypothetical protein
MYRVHEVPAPSSAVTTGPGIDARIRRSSPPLWPARASLVVLLLFLGGRAAAVRAQTLQPGQPLEPGALSWPRFYFTNGLDFAVYQPQISQWPGNQLEGRFVVAVRPTGTTNESYGVVFFRARTEIDKVNRLVTLEDFQMTRVRFPTRPSQQDQYLGLLRSFQAHTMRVIPLDHLEAVLAASADVAKAKIQEVKNDPPRLIYTTQPSLLVLVDGPPVLKPLTGNCERVVNTRPVLVYDNDPLNAGYYLFANGSWYAAPSVEGPWNVAASPPLDLGAALDAASATKEVDLLLPKDTNAAPTTLPVYVSTIPAELIQTTGAPNLLTIDGTDLLYVSNTDQAILYYLDDGQYYLLISGRWFKATALYGPWAFVPPGKLPADFQKIPPDHLKANVLASVPGTPQAQEAVIANSIPQTATIQRAQAKLTIRYEGASPGFAKIAGTPLSYATNSATPVVQVDARTYCACQAGVWFVATGPAGPWVVATSVPRVIYTIPASCPIHYVTYAYIYGSTPSVVYVGYTPGYAGTVVGLGGVVVYGTGYYYPPVIVGTTYVSYPPTYGYGAGLALGMGVGFAFGYAAGASCACWCEPHWGCYAYAPYNYTHVNVNATSFYTSWGTAVHASGSYGYNAYTGTSWGSQHASTFNPYTGATGQASRGAAYNPYSGNYAAGRQGSYYNPTTGRYGAGETTVSGNVRDGTASVSSRGYAGNVKTGNAVAWNNGNMYADKNGNLYSYNSSSGAQKYNSSSGSWQSVSKPASSSYSGASSWQSRVESERSSWDSSSASRSWGGSSSWADRAGASQFGGENRFSGWQRSGGGGWGGFRSGGGWRR